MDLTIQPAKLCTLIKWPNYEGYGFDLVTKKSGQGHYISKVHPGGPGEATSLQQGDWVIEVNSVNVEQLGHSDVIQMIKNSPKGTVKLLVVPPETEKWRKRHEMVINSNHPDLVHCITPEPSKGKINSYLNETLERISRSTLNGHKKPDLDPDAGYHRYSIPSPPEEWPASIDDKSTIKVDDKIDGRTEEVTVELNLSSNKVDSTTIDVNGHNKVNGDSKVFKSNSNVHLITKDKVDSHSNLVTAEINSTSANGIISHVTTITILDREFFARLCKLRRDDSEKGFGFKLDSLPGGHFLREINPNGPAAKAGIEEDDRLIEVNNVNVEYTNHRNLVNMIKNSPNQEITLLVVDKQAYEWFESRNIRIHHGTTSLIRDLTMGSPHKKDSSPSSSESPSRKLNTSPFSRSSSQCRSIDTPFDEPDNERSSVLRREDLSQSLIPMPVDAPSPRLCTLVKRSNQRFGFTLNTYQKDGVKLIADIEPASIAKLAGLRQWDRLVEVNGVNINSENHAQIKARIEASSEVLVLLVVPDSEYEWYETRKLVPRSNQSNVIHCTNEVNAENYTSSSRLVNRHQSDVARNERVSLWANSRAASIPASQVDGTRTVESHQANGKIEQGSGSSSSVLINEYIERSSREAKSHQEKEKEEQLLSKLRRLSAKELRSILPANKRQAYELSSNLDFEEKIVFFNNL